MRLPTTHTFIEDFRAEYGLTPYAGAETLPADGGGAAAPAAPESTPAPAAAGGDPGTAPAEPTAPAADPYAERMDAVLGRLEGLAQQAPQGPPAPDPQQQAIDAQLDRLFPGLQSQPTQPQPGQPGQPQPPQDPTGLGLSPEDLQAFDPLVRQGVESVLRDQVQPAFRELLQEVTNLRSSSENDRISRETSELLNDYPVIRDDANYRAALGQEAVAQAQALGLDPAIAREPGFIELVHLAEQTVQRGQGETPAGQQPSVPVEGAPGAAPAPAAAPQDRAAQIKAAGRQVDPVVGW